MFRNQRSKAGQRPHGQSGKGGNGHQPNHPLIDVAVVLFPLQPNPFIGARGIYTLAGESRGQVVVGEISVE